MSKLDLEIQEGWTMYSFEETYNAALRAKNCVCIAPQAFHSISHEPV